MYSELSDSQKKKKKLDLKNVEGFIFYENFIVNASFLG